MQKNVGVNGCYYNGMSEEGIIEFIDQVNGIQGEYKHKPILEKNIVNVGIAIQSGLNLYQQEKEKNKKLEKEINEENKRCMFLAVENNDLKEKNKKLEKEIIELQMAQLPDTSETYKELKNKLEE